MQLRMVSCFLILTLLFAVISVMAQIQGSQITLARNSDLIVIGEAVSISRPFLPSATNEPLAYQSIIFRVENVLRGNFSRTFLRTMVIYDKEILDKYPQFALDKTGIKYIVLL